MDKSPVKIYTKRNHIFRRVIACRAKSGIGIHVGSPLTIRSIERFTVRQQEGVAQTLFKGTLI